MHALLFSLALAANLPVGARQQAGAAQIEKAAAELRSANPGIQASAMFALADLGATQYAGEIAAILKGNALYWVKRDAVKALARLGARQHVGDIAPFLRAEQEELKTASLLALVTLRSSEHARDIAVLLGDKSLAVRSRAVEGLADLGAIAYVPQIAQLLTDSVGYVRGSAAEGLAALGARQHAPAILPLLMDKEGDVRKAATASLKKLGYLPSASDVFRIAADRVVLIEVETSNGTSTGAGFVISVDGRLITNKHVVVAARTVSSIRVRFRDGRSFAVDGVRHHPVHDLALIQIRNPPPALSYLHFADALPPVGDDLVIIGHPAGLGWSLSQGRVSQIRDDPGGERQVWIQTDGAMNPGNSGGPMLDRYGQVVGVATQGLTRMGDQNLTGLNFGIRALIIERFLRWK